MLVGVRLLNKHRNLAVSVVLASFSSECVLIQALEKAFASTSFSLSVRSHVQQIKAELEAFASKTDLYLWLGYVSAQLYQFYKVDMQIVQYLSRITLGEWGSIFDLDRIRK